MEGARHSAFVDAEAEVAGVVLLAVGLAAVQIGSAASGGLTGFTNTWRIGPETERATIRRQERVGELSASISSQSSLRTINSSTGDEATRRMRL